MNQLEFLANTHKLLKVRENRAHKVRLVLVFASLVEKLTRDF